MAYRAMARGISPMATERPLIALSQFSANYIGICATEADPKYSPNR